LADAVIVAPSFLASDFEDLGDAVRDVTASGADWNHLDITAIAFSMCI
jgi:ribulose-phosphate 3-epimerase